MDARNSLVRNSTRQIAAMRIGRSGNEEHSCWVRVWDFRRYASGFGRSSSPIVSTGNAEWDIATGPGIEQRRYHQKSGGTSSKLLLKEGSGRIWKVR